MKIPGLLFLLLIPGTAVADLVEDVRCQEIGFSKAAEVRDVDSFVSFIDADARFVGSEVARGPDAVKEAWRVFFTENGPQISWRPRFTEVLKDGTLALSRGPYRVLAPDENGGLIESWGTFNSVWRRADDGTWKVVFDAGNPGAGELPESDRALLDQDDECP